MDSVQASGYQPASLWTLARATFHRHGLDQAVGCEGLHPIIQWSDNDMLNLWIGIRPYENGVLRGDIQMQREIIFWFHIQGSWPVAFSSILPSRMTKQRRRHVVFERRHRAQRQLGSQLVANTKGDLWISQRDERPGNWSTNRLSRA